MENKDLMSNYKWTKKPVTIEAFRLGYDAMPDWFMAAKIANKITTHNEDKRLYGGPDYCLIETLEGQMRGNYGDYIIQGVKGEIYPCKPDIFDATYARAQSVDVDMDEIKAALEANLGAFKQIPDDAFGFAEDGSGDEHGPHRWSIARELEAQTEKALALINAKEPMRVAGTHSSLKNYRPDLVEALKNKPVAKED